MGTDLQRRSPENAINLRGCQSSEFACAYWSADVAYMIRPQYCTGWLNFCN
jgi:hypothetical protein